jgi:hypothetical protein
MLSLLREPNSCIIARSVLSWILEALGEKQSIPLFVKILQDDRMIQDNRSCGGEYELVEGYILWALYESKDKRAVEFFLEQLYDPDAPPLYRRLAFTSLARTGGKKGLKAVLAFRDRKRTTAVLKHAGLEKLGTNIMMGPKERYSWTTTVELVDTREDAKGVLWGLISSGTLGSRKDLWITRRIGRRWSEPIFTGSTFETLADSDWFSNFVGNAKIAKDSDGDALTDLVERRLGTNPNLADTDGDGLKDSIDKNPLAAPRKFSDLERVLAAAFEGVFRFVGWNEVPAIVTLPEGVEPMEFMGGARTVLVRRAEEKHPEGWADAEDAVGVRFSIGPWSLELEKKGWKRQRLLVLWNKDRTQARLHVDVDHRGSSLHLRKFGDDWVVIWGATTRMHDLHVIHDDME